MLHLKFHSIGDMQQIPLADDTLRFLMHCDFRPSFGQSTGARAGKYMISLVDPRICISNILLLWKELLRKGGGCQRRVSSWNRQLLQFSQNFWRKMTFVLWRIMLQPPGARHNACMSRADFLKGQGSERGGALWIREAGHLTDSYVGTRLECAWSCSEWGCFPPVVLILWSWVCLLIVTHYSKLTYSLLVILGNYLLWRISVHFEYKAAVGFSIHIEWVLKSIPRVT